MLIISYVFKDEPEILWKSGFGVRDGVGQSKFRLNSSKRKILFTSKHQGGPETLVPEIALDGCVLSRSCRSMIGITS